MTTKGHNSGPINADRLKSFVERIEKLEEERKAIGGDIRDVYAEAKGVGYDVKTMRKVVRLRGMDAADRAEEESLLDTYLHALGMTMGNAVREVMAGAGVRATAAKHGVSRSALSRSVPKSDDEPDLGTPTEHSTTAAGEKGEEDAGAKVAIYSPTGATPRDACAFHGVSADPQPFEVSGQMSPVTPARRPADESPSTINACNPDAAEPDDLAIPDFLKRKPEGVPA